MNESTKGYFGVCVKILECRNLSTQNKYLSTQVCVKIGDEKQYSKVIQHATNPFFDDYFVFTKYMCLLEFTDSLITISALHVRRGIKVRKLIGCISMDIAKVWNQPDRQLKKWFVLSLPSDHSGQMKAFLECHFKIVASATAPNEPLQLTHFDSNEVIGSKRARYKVLIYHCSGLQEQATQSSREVSVRILYAGKSVRTTRTKIGHLVEWNEQIGFLELFPPMRQTLTLEVLVGKKLLAIKSFNVIDFFKLFHGGILNIFGPTIVHLYAENYLYRGSLLMSLECEIIGQLKDFEYVDGVTITKIEPISQLKYGINRSFVCFGVIFELIITKANCSKDNFYLSLEMGRTKNVQSQRYSAISFDKFLYVPFDEQKPCISLTGEWPDCTHRLYNSNLMANITDSLRDKLETSLMFTSRGCEDDAKNVLYTAFHNIQNKCKRVIQLLSKGITELDAKRTLFFKKQVNLLALLASGISLNNVTETYNLFSGVLDNFCEDAQDSLPLLIITLCQSKTIVGSCLLHPRHLIFSQVKEKQGRNSAKINNLVFKGNNGEIVARMDAWLWLGNREQLDKCEEQLPPGYKPYPRPEVKMDQLPFPSSLTYSFSHTYTAICHIHSACIDGEAVSEGECDSFVKVFFFNQCRQTVTAKRTLAPTWKETLILKGIKLYSSPKYLVESPPPLTVQLWNGATDPPKLIGSQLISPSVWLQPLKETPDFTLKWWAVGNRCEVLLACEMFQNPTDSDVGEVLSIRRQSSLIPKNIEPPAITYRLEVVFWGIRPLYPRALKNIVQPQVLIQISTATISSGVIARANKTFNFKHDSRIVSLMLPENRIYSPPLIIKIISNFKYLTSISEKNIHRYDYQLPMKSQWNALNSRKAIERVATVSGYSHRVAFPDLIPQTEVSNKHASSLGAILDIPNKLKTMISDFSLFSKLETISSLDDELSIEESSDDELDQDWWDRYWNNQINIYHNTLENQKEFSGFTDVLTTYTIKEIKNDVGDYNELGKLKAIITLYKWPVKVPVVTMQGQDPEMGILKLTELNSRVNLLVRVYCVNATDLYPSDLNGKSDPYIEIATPSKTVSDDANKILGELNPVFGSCLEVIASLPVDSMLAVRVMDWDALSKNDIIGETIIDIENRFYSRHRATCGLPDTYSTAGPNAWRDIETPTEILERLCNAHNLPLPQYYEKSVKIGSKEFLVNKFSTDEGDNLENLALAALNKWEDMPIVGRPLVGEHVETRLLFREEQPGLVRGKLNMWVDLFDMSLGHIPLPIDITPRSPQAFELRVNILNTAKIPLINKSAIGNKKYTDIMVTGWLGDPRNVQKTDVHHSYTGTGNFNWRFVFPFLYYRKENKMVFNKKKLLDTGKPEEKLPAVLHLEVYDCEGILDVSFIGGMMLEMCQMPRGVHSVRAYKAEKFFDQATYVDLFKVESLKGWWPFLVDKMVMKNAGFLEAEFFLVTAEEAHKYPVGLGRSPPDPLPAPARVCGRNNHMHVFEDILARHNCTSFFGLTLDILIIFSLIVLVGILIYILPHMVAKLIPWLDKTFWSGYSSER